MNVGMAFRSFIVLSTLAISPYALAECYIYDDLGRLTDIVYDDANSAKMSYVLDEHGNRTTVDVVTSQSVTCAEPSGTTTAGNANTNIPDYEHLNASSQSQSSNSNQGANSAPVADNAAFALITNNIQTIFPLVGDTDADGDSLTLTSFNETSPLIHTTQVGNSLLITSGGATGSTSIAYVVSDGQGGSDIGTITITLSQGANTSDPCDTFPVPLGCPTNIQTGLIE